MKLWHVYETIRDFYPDKRQVRHRDVTFHHVTGDLPGTEWTAEPYEGQSANLGMMKTPLPRSEGAAAKAKGLSHHRLRDARTADRREK